jgi:rod shape determining protein RodA
MGSTSKGAQRWLALGGFRFQPSELMKIAVPLMLARFLTDKGLPASSWRIFIGLGLLMLPVLLIAKQPDLGTALLVFASGFMALFLAGLPWWWMGGMAGVIAVLGPVLWTLLHDYQRERIWTFLDPERDPLGSGYNIIQSKIALGSGGWWGKGFGHGTQAHLDFLPEHTTDFIFAVFGEEFGLVGTWCLLALYLSILWQCYKMSLYAKDSFNRVLSGTLTFTFGVYFVVNIGMVSGVLPVVGVPLPLVSYGGTSLLSLLVAFGMIMATTTRPPWMTS